MTQKLSPMFKGKTLTVSLSVPEVVCLPFTRSPNVEWRKIRWQQTRRVSSQTAAKETDDQHQGDGASNTAQNAAITQIARQKQANREFFTNLLSSAATKRDAKAYITRLKSRSNDHSGRSRPPASRPRVNLGGLFRSARAVEQSPVFSQYEIEQEAFTDTETLHVALVKLCDLHQMPDNIVVGIAETLTQLARLSMSPCVVLESSYGVDQQARRQLKLQAERLSAAIDAMRARARIVEDIFTVTEAGIIIPSLSMRNLLRVPLRRGRIPLVIPTAYSEQNSRIVSIPADNAILTLTKEFAKLGNQNPSNQISLDRIIVIDKFGGVPNPASNDGNHVFLNLEQEHAAVTQQLQNGSASSSKRHLQNLNMLRQALQQLPHSASGLMATAEEAANVISLEQDSSPSLVGTRRQKNTLIHNLLTDKPSYSSSLPKSRLSRRANAVLTPSAATFIKHGIPLTILPNPLAHPWTPDGPRIRLTDPDIDLDRLVYLIDDSFNRNLDTKAYIRRVNECLAGIIIAGDYEGGAILTWETPPGADPSDPDRLVPYLDKFAVLKRSQGAGGVADIVFNAMVRTCFPKGVCWRSRKNNPVNKWYFERSTGTKKFPDMNWTMFWTTPGVIQDRQRFMDYEGVCRGVEPTWLDKKMAAD